MYVEYCIQLVIEIPPTNAYTSTVHKCIKKYHVQLYTNL